jgi:Glycosyl-hydrolase family 116, catalytic region
MTGRRLSENACGSCKRPPRRPFPGAVGGAVIMVLIAYSARALTAENTPVASSGGPSGGYVVGNFAISAQVAEVTGPEFWIKVNPPKLGVWLQNLAHGELWIRESGGAGRKLSLRAVHVSRLYPEYEATFEAEGSLRVKVNLFAPVGLDARIGFLPGLILEVKVESDRPWSGVLGLTLTQARAEPGSEDDDDTPWPTALKVLRTADMAGAARGRAFLVAGGAPPDQVSATSEANRLVVSVPVNANAQSHQTVTFATGAFDRNGRYTREQRNVGSLAEDLITQARILREQLHLFVDALPRIGDAEIDRYLRWYVSAGILLTKGDRDGHVLTMGYRELNPRDSFWTSALHLVFWKELERTMLLETALGQKPSGRIPSTLLPLIDRGDEIDSSEYFILRSLRYYRWYRDKAVLAHLWPAVRKAIDYLSSRDLQHVGVPMQQSYWADWKDVPAVRGRRYAPHFALLWVASLRAAAEFAVAMNEAGSAVRYATLADRAAAFLNLPYAEGGMWNGHNYVERWEDGQLRPYVLEDQLVGAYFRVIPAGRLNQIYEAIRASETPWGVREKYPYQTGWTEESGGTGGNYHNGGIWPYLNFVDATGRYLHGYAADAERIIHEIGHADLDAGGDEKPGEYLNGETGDNRGFALQGWDAALFSTIYSGALGLERPSISRINIHPHVPNGRDFSTRLVLPACTGKFSRKSGKSIWHEDQGQCLRQGISVVLEEMP